MKRSAGRSAVAAAAYRAAERLNDERRQEIKNYTRRGGVSHKEILTPDRVPAWAKSRESLWNAVEAAERRKDAQVAREVRVAIPIELGLEGQVALVREFAMDQFVRDGMVADVAIHDADSKNPHAHILLTTRLISSDGFGCKNREWNKKDSLMRWRSEWARHANLALERAGHDVRIDHRSYKEQGIDLEPTLHTGISAKKKRRDGRDIVHDLCAHNDKVLRVNTERIARRPEIALDALSKQNAVFTKRDLAIWLHSHAEDDVFTDLLAKCLASPELVSLGHDATGGERFTVLGVLEQESILVATAEKLAQRRRHIVSDRNAREPSARRSMSLSQELAYRYLTQESGDLAMVQGYAGAGKSYMLGAAREAWEAQGLRVLGGGFSGRAAKSLQEASGIESRTLDSWLSRWSQGFDEVTKEDVFVIDEAGMLGTEKCRQVAKVVEAARAKLVVVGDTEQLQPIQFGSPMRALAERFGQVVLSDVIRQKEPWQREATRAMGSGDCAAGISAYVEKNCFREHAEIEQAVDALVAEWAQYGPGTEAEPNLMLAYRRVDVADLNQRGREFMRNAGRLGNDRVFVLPETERSSGGEKSFASGDRLVFLKNDSRMGVKNGTTGTVESVGRNRLRVAIDGESRCVEIKPQSYGHFDHGYAVTVHKSQGGTYARVFVLATKNFFRQLSYVALSRHKDAVSVHYSSGSFATTDELVEGLSRDSEQANALDFAAQYDLEEDLRPDQKAGRPAYELAPESERLEVRAADRVAVYMAMADAGLVAEQKRLSELAAGAIQIPAVFGASTERMDEVSKGLEAAHTEFVAATKAWHEHLKEQGRDPSKSTWKPVLGEAGRLYRATQSAAKRRDPFLKELRKLRRKSRSIGKARDSASEHNRTVREARRDLEALEYVQRQRAISAAELEHTEHLGAWIEFAHDHPTEAATAHFGKGESGELWKAEREAGKVASDLRWQLASTDFIRSQLFPRGLMPAEGQSPVPAKDQLPAAETRWEAAVRAWEGLKDLQSAQEIAEARQGKGAGAQVHQELRNAANRRRELRAQLAGEAKTLRFGDLEPRLAEAEKSYSAALDAWRQYNAKYPERERVARQGVGKAGKLWTAERDADKERGKLELQLRRAYGLKDDAEIEPSKEQPAVPAKDQLPAAETRWEAAVRAWEGFKDLQSAQEIAEARRGRGAGAQVHQELRKAGSRRRELRAQLAGEAKTLRFGDLEPRLAEAEKSYSAALDAWRQYNAKYPEREKVARQGVGKAGKLWTAERDADKERGELELQLRRAYGLKDDAEIEPSKEQPAGRAALRTAERGYLDLARQWVEVCRDKPVEAGHARRLQGPCADLYQRYCAAGALRREIIRDVAEKDREQRIAALEPQLDEAESLYSGRLETWRAYQQSHPQRAELGYRGVGEAGRLWTAERDADKERGKLERQLRRVYGLKDDAAAKPSKEQPAVSAKDQLPAAETRWEAAVRAWEGLKDQQSAQEIAEARQGKGAGAQVHQELRAAAEVRRELRAQLAEEAKIQRIEDLEPRLAEAEKSYSAALDAWRQYNAKYPEREKVARQGVGKAGKLWTAERDADKERGELELQLRRAYGLKDDAAAEPSKEQPAVPAKDQLPAAETRWEASVRAWEGFKDQQSAQEIAEARQGRGAGAQVHQELRAAAEVRRELRPELAQERPRGAEMLRKKTSAIKRDVNLIEYAVAHGYELNKRKSTRRSAVLSKDDDKLVVSRGKDGAWIYFSVANEGDSGTIVDFVRNRTGSSVAQAVEQVGAWAVGRGEGGDGLGLALEFSERSPERVRASLAKMSKAESSLYLDLRGLTAEVLTDSRFEGTVYLDDRYNAVFPHQDEDGEICGYEVKGRNFTGFSAGGQKGIWASNQMPEDRRLVVAESAIDAMSYHKLHGDQGTRYFSTCGSIGARQREALTKALEDMPKGAKVVLAFDKDDAGERFAKQVGEMAPDHVEVVRHTSDREKDWNDELQRQERERQVERERQPGPYDGMTADELAGRGREPEEEIERGDEELSRELEHDKGRGGGFER